VRATLSPAPDGWARLLAAGGLIALLGGLAAIVLSSGGPGTPSPSSSPAATASPATATAATPARAADVRLVVTGVGAYDPDGDGAENDGDARLATDGNGATAWKSEHYRSTFRKSGVGLVLDAGRPVRATRVTVISESPGFRAEVRVGNGAKGPFVAASAPRLIGGRTTLKLRPLRSRYLVIWITSMPGSGTAAVNEVAVRVRG
jgi:hypothetical protein